MFRFSSSLRLVIASTCTVLIAFSSACLPGYCADFNTAAQQAQSLEQSGKTLEAYVRCCEALRLNPSSAEIKNKQAILYNKITSPQQLTAGSDPDGERSVRMMMQAFSNTWNTHNLGEFRQVLTQDFKSSDGMTYDQTVDILRQTWQLYPTSKAYLEVKNVRVQGDYAEVESTTRIVGAMQNMMNMGNINTYLHDIWSLRKSNDGWKISGQCILEEFVTVTFGPVDNINAHLTVPHTVTPGSQYNAVVDALLPQGYSATVGMVTDTPSWPMQEPSFNWVLMSGPDITKQFTANSQGKMEDVSARINVSNAYTGQAVGMIWLSKRINIVDTVTQIASTPPPVTPTRTIVETPVAKPPVVETQSIPEAQKLVKADKPVRDKWAIIVGISNFQDPKIPKLQYSAKDAIDFYKFLEKQGNFRRDHMRLLLNEKATQRRILTELATLFLHRVAEPDDLVVVFFSTHGSPTEEGPGGNNYLVAYDTSVEELFASGVSMQAIMSTLKDRINSDRILLVLDACHSGATAIGAKGMSRAANFDAESIAQGSGQLVICSSEPDERSWESKRSANGVFTKKLIEGLSKNGNMTTLGDAFKYLQSQVQREVKEDRGAPQTPVLKSKWNGAQLLPLALPANPEPVPATLLQQLPPDSSSEVKY